MTNVFGPASAGVASAPTKNSDRNVLRTMFISLQTSGEGRYSRAGEPVKRSPSRRVPLISELGLEEHLGGAGGGVAELGGAVAEEHERADRELGRVPHG